MLKILLKKQMAEAFRGFFYDQKKNKARSHNATAVFILLYAFLMIVLVGGGLAVYGVELAPALASVDLLWFYDAVFALIALGLGVFGSVFNTFAGLYQGKDNDLLLSLPIPVRYILFSRLIGVYLMGLMFSGVVLLPTWIVRLIFAPFSASALFGGLIQIVLISILVFVLTCLLGWVVAKIASKLKNKSFLTVLIALVLIALYYVVYFKGYSAMTAIIHNPETVDGAAIKGKAYPVYLIGQVGEGRLIPCLIVAAVILVAAFLTFLVLDRTFIKIATTPASESKKRYKETTAKMRPLWLTALIRETRRFTSNAGYMLNLGLGAVFAPVLGVLAIVKGPAFAARMIDAGLPAGSIGMGLAGLFCIAAAMNCIAAPSVSLEGSGIDLVRSLPIPTKTVLLAKAENHILFTVPPLLIGSILGVIGLREYISVASAVFVFVLPLVFCCFTAFYDLTLNLLMPNLHWTTEMTVIKQSAVILVAILSAPAIGMVLTGGGVALSLVLPAVLVGLILTAPLILATVGLYFAVTVWGVRVFDELQ